MCLCTFLDTHLQIDGVTYNIYFGRLQVIEQITIIPVIVTHGIFIFSEAFVHQFLIVDIALLHTENLIQIVCCHHRISNPRDITDIITLAFINLYEDIDMLLIIIPYGVFQDNSITIAQLIILIYQCFLCLFIAFCRKFLCLEEIR